MTFLLGFFCGAPVWILLTLAFIYALSQLLASAKQEGMEELLKELTVHPEESRPQPPSPATQPPQAQAMTFILGKDIRH